MKKEIQTIKDIRDASTNEDILSVLNLAEQRPSSLITKEIVEEKNKKQRKIGLGILAVLLIIFVVRLAYIGGEFISSHLGLISLLVGLLDLTVLTLLLTDSVKGRARLIALAVEILSLLYFGYTINGCFIGDNLKITAEKKIAEANEILKTHYESVQSAESLFKEAVESAKNISQTEDRRDGKGIMFETSNRISNIEVTFTSKPPKPAAAPEFNNLAEGNEWINDQREKISDLARQYDARMDVIKIQAQSTAKSLENIRELVALVPEQLGSLETLISLMESIGKKEKVTAEIPSQIILTADDVKSDAFQMFIGYIIDGVVIFVIIMIYFQKPSEKNIQQTKDEETRSLIESALIKQDIMPDLQNIDVEKAFDTLKLIEGNKNLLNFLKEKASFGEFILFEQDYPKIAKKITDSQWTLAEIREELEKDPKFLNIAQKVTKIKPGDWKNLKTITSPENLENLLEIDEDKRNKFINIIKQMQLKTKLKDRDLRELIGNFRFQEVADDDYLKTLENFITNVKNNELLLKADFKFIETASPDVAEYLFKILNSEKHVGKITSGWNEQLDKSISEILGNEIKNDPNFENFMDIVVNQGGINGIKKMVVSYCEQKKKVESGAAIGNKILKLKFDFHGIEKSLLAENEPEFLKKIGESLAVESGISQN